MNNRIIHIQDIDSTNNYLKKLVSNGTIEEGTVVWSDFQSAGKGQRGNSWESEAGQNLLFSIILYPGMVTAGRQFILSQVVSLAVADCLKKYAGNITIKWPNDIYWREKKICGMLLENTLTGDRIGQCVAGIGINVNQTEFKSNAPNPVSLAQITGICLYSENILDETLNNISHYYDKLKAGEDNEVMKQYKESLFRKDGYHLYNDEETDFYARIKDIEPSGILVLETEDNRERHFAFKEVKYIL
jgi:BirA family biotin operon repressor/biotin-[acetyl-CoA-carboxylase] ligase